MSTEGEPVVVSRHGHTLLITMNRPKVRNAANLQMARGMEAAMRRLATDDDLRVGVVTGADGTFSAGGDIHDGLAGNVIATPAGGPFGFFDIRPDKPLIAAIEGMALGGGLELALQCDVIVAARGALLGLPEVRNAMMALGGGLRLLPRRLPYHVAMDMCLTGEPRRAEELAAFGFVSRLSEPGEAVSLALGVAERIVANGPIAVAATRRIVAAMGALDDDLARKREQEEMTMERLSATADFLEGARSFLEKRTPQWQNR